MPDDPQTARRVLEKMRERSREHRQFAGVPCQCESSWHADEIDGWVAEFDAALAAVPVPAPAPHRCCACGLRWEGELKGAELCGDCWRAAWARKAVPPAEPAPEKPGWMTDYHWSQIQEKPKRPPCEHGDCRDHYGDPEAWCPRCREAAEPAPPAPVPCDRCARLEAALDEHKARVRKLEQERDRLRAALVKVRAHTAYMSPDPNAVQPGEPRNLQELLQGLLHSIERIVDAALAEGQPTGETDGK